MATSSVRDLGRLLHTFLSGDQAAQPLTDSDASQLQSFVEAQAKVDDVTSQKIHNELLDNYTRHVAGDHEKFGRFVSILRHLRPTILGLPRLTEWWQSCLRPVVDGIGYRRFVVEDAREFVLGVLVYDADDDKARQNAEVSTTFTHRLLTAYLERTKIPSSPEDVVTPEDEYIARELETLLVAFGRKMPKQLLLALDAAFVRKETRAQALGILSSFVRTQPPHLHLVLETDLVDHLYDCLTLDNSTIVISLALTVFIMILPHITRTLTGNVGKLFWIYARLLCWDKIAAMELKKKKKPLAGSDEICYLEEDEPEEQVDKTRWSCTQNTFQSSESTPPDVLHYFTFLYGLFPLNFTRFLRKPQKFLDESSSSVLNITEIDSASVRSRSEAFRRVHLLHPNFYTLDAEDELEESRWLKSDPSDVVTDCMGLYVSLSDSLDDPGPPPQGKLPAPPPSAISVSNAALMDALSATQDHRSVQSTNSKLSASTSPTFSLDDLEPPDSPTLPTPPFSSASQTSIRKKARGQSPGLTQKDGLDAFADRVSHSPSHDRLGMTGQALKDVTRLQREVMLLKNDLGFERFLKQQHLNHIGHLQRRNIKDATVEADTQNLINKNRSLKGKLARSDELYEQLKKETAMTRNQSKKWEADLSAKLRTYREDKKILVTEKTALEAQLKDIQDNTPMLNQVLRESQANEVLLQARLQTLRNELEDLNSVRREVDMLQSKIRSFELKELEFEQTREERDVLRAKLRTSKLELNSRDSEIRRIKRTYDNLIAELELQISRGSRSRTTAPEDSQTLTQPTTQIPPGAQTVLSSSLADSQVKMGHLRDVHDQLGRRYAEIENRNRHLERQHPGEAEFLDEISRQREVLRTRQAATGARASEPDRNTAAFEYDDDEFIQNAHRLQTEDDAPPPLDRDLSSFPAASSSARRQLDSTHHESYPLAPDTNRYTMHSQSVEERDFSVVRTENPPVDAQHARTNSDSSGLVGVHSSASQRSSRSGPRSSQQPKVTPKSELRIYGRGGRQNVGKKKKSITGDEAGTTTNRSSKSGTSSLTGSLLSSLKGNK